MEQENKNNPSAENTAPKQNKSPTRFFFLWFAIPLIAIIVLVALMNALD